MTGDERPPFVGRAALLVTAAAVTAGAMGTALAVVAVELAVDRVRHWRHLRLPLRGTGEHVVLPAWPWACSRCGRLWLTIVDGPNPARCP